jgi:hypothetical protein
MKLFNQAILFILTIAFGLLILLYVSGYINKPNDNIESQSVNVRTEYKIDTILVSNPIPYEVKVVDTLFLVDSLVIRDTILDIIILPIEQKTYKDSNYVAYVSGYTPKLDSISVYNRIETKYITIENKYKAKRWGLGIQTGYGLYKDGFTPYVGIGISYNLINF